jgi:hypothetical protein
MQNMVHLSLRRIHARIAAVAAAAALLACGLAAGDHPVLTDDYERQVAAADLSNRQAAAAADHLRAWPGIVADRRARRIELLAVATGIEGESPVEFFLVGANGKDYEALAVTGVTPSELHAALVFIGVPPGRPVAFGHFHFWPKGERVTMTMAAAADPKAEPTTVAALVHDRRTRRALPDDGLVFVGSAWRQADDEPARQVCEADLVGDIASVFNDPWTLLDVPRRVDQATVYNQLVANPEQLLTAGTILRVVIAAVPVEQPRVVTFTLAATAPAAATSADELQLTLTTAGADKPAATGDVGQVLNHLFALLQAGREPFLTLRIAPRVPLAVAVELAALLARVDGQGLIHVEPEPGHPYHQAFLPEPAWRDPTKRPGTAVEIRVASRGEQLAGRVSVVDDVFENGAFHEREMSWPFADLAALRALTSGRESWPTDDVLIFLPAGATYGDVAAIYAAVREQLPTAFIFGPAP